MALRPSRADVLAALTADLAGGDPVRRESAAARLAIMGERAVAPLIDAASTAADAGARAAALRSLAAIADRRAFPLAVRLSGDARTEVALEAIALAGVFVRGTGDAATEALDHLTGLVLDPRAPIERRAAALAELDGQPRRLVERIHQALAADASAAALRPDPERGARALDDLVEDRATTPRDLTAAVERQAPAATLASLRCLLDEVRRRERDAAAGERPGWTAVRGRLHAEFAARGSRMALYNLREAIGAARQPLPPDFVLAAAAVGDATCLDPIAAAWTADTADRPWREQLAGAFERIVRRTGLTRRAPELRRILERRPATGPLIALARR